jgi:hypothetical protein
MFVLFFLFGKTGLAIPPLWRWEPLIPSGIRQPSELADGMCQATLLRRLGVLCASWAFSKAFA